MANPGNDKLDRKQQQKESEKLVGKLVDAIDANPTQVQNYYDLGALLTRLNSHEQAEELFMKALGLFKGQSKAVNLLNYGLGNLYYEAGKYQDAIKYYNQIDDNNLKADAYLMLAQSFTQMKDYKRAIAYGLTAHDLRKQDPEINLVMGDALLAIGNFKQAKEFYDDILKRHPGRADTQFNRGLVAMVLGEDYVDYLKQAKQLNPDYYERSEKRIDDIQKALNKQRDSK